MNVLIINPFGIGDVLFSLPLVQNLKYYFPESKIVYLCNKRTASLLYLQSYIDSISVFEKDDWRNKFRNAPFKTIRDFVIFLKKLKRNKFNLVFDLSLAQEFGFFCFLIGINLRLGYDYRGRGIFLNKKYKLTGYQEKHMVEYYLALLNFLNLTPVYRKITLELPPSIIDWAKNELSNLKAKYGLILSLIPGGGASWGKDAYKKLWPMDKYKELLFLIKKEIKSAVLLLGDEKDSQKFGEIPQEEGILNYLGKTNLLQFAALISQSDFIVTNDGGALHLAEAFSVPTLSIFGPVPKEVYGPYPPEKIHKVLSLNLPCQPCYKNFRIPECKNYACLNKLEVALVLKELKKHLSFIFSEV